MSQSKTVVVSIPSANGEEVKYRITQELLASTVLDMINNGSPEVLSKFSEDYIIEILDIIQDIMEPEYKKQSKERILKYLRETAGYP